MLATGARPRGWYVLDEAGKAVEGVLDISQRKPIYAYSSFHMLSHSKPTVTLLGPVRTSEAQRTQLHYSRSQRWTVAARIQSKSDSEASGMPPFFSFTVFCLPGGGKESQG